MEGVGRVTATRLFSHFASYEDLLRYPREQVLTRLKGAPRSEALVATLFDQPAMHSLLADARSSLDSLHRQRVEVLTSRDAAWPPGLSGLPRQLRPFLLHAYGSLEVLHRPVVSFFAHPPISPDSFERAQDLIGRLLSHQVVPGTGAAHGFDVVVNKLCYGGPATHPSLLVASAGMARVPPSIRPTVSAVVRTGGVFLSPFAMKHGPFSHDDKERALVQAALARACVFFEPLPDTPEWHALTWAVEAGRPVFGIASDQHPMPDQVHPLRNDVDFDWVLAASQTEA